LLTERVGLCHAPGVQDLAFWPCAAAAPPRPPPAAAAIGRHAGAAVLPAGQAVEVYRDGHVLIGGRKYQLGTGLAATTVTMRLEGHLMHAIADGAWRAPGPARCPPSGPRGWPAPAPLPPPPMPAGSIAARRRVHASGRIMVNNQPIKLGPRMRARSSPSSSRAPATGHLMAGVPAWQTIGSLRVIHEARHLKNNWRSTARRDKRRSVSRKNWVSRLNLTETNRRHVPYHWILQRRDR
jgi:hypothetical protein